MVIFDLKILVLFFLSCNSFCRASNSKVNIMLEIKFKWKVFCESELINHLMIFLFINLLLKLILETTNRYFDKQMLFYYMSFLYDYT